MTNKLLLAAIAVGLWANAAIWLVRPVQAQSDQLAGGVQQIAEELRQLVEAGEKCINPQLCQRPTSASSLRRDGAPICWRTVNALPRVCSRMHGIGSDGFFARETRAVPKDGQCVVSDGAALTLWDTVMIALVIGSTILFCFWARIRATGGDG
jgi:hypothetical protein